jgi:hypothetical protein
MKLSAWPAVALGAVLALGFARAPFGSEVASYDFRDPPVNSMGVRGLADLRGMPVLIDFWGTR